MTFQKWVHDYQLNGHSAGPDGRVLDADGLLGPATEWSLAIDDLPRLRRNVVGAACGHFGAREIKGQPNRGTLPDRVLQFVGAPLGSPWCAAFVSYVLDLAGVPALRTASARECLQQFPQIHDPSDVEPGDLFGWVNPDGTGHVGFVIGLRSGDRGPTHVITLEGNSANQVRICARPFDGLQFRALPVQQGWHTDVPSAPVVVRETQGTR